MITSFVPLFAERGLKMVNRILLFVLLFSLGFLLAQYLRHGMPWAMASELYLSNQTLTSGPIPPTLTCLNYLGAVSANAILSVVDSDTTYELHLEIEGRYNGTIDYFYKAHTGNDPLFDVDQAQKTWTSTVCASHTTAAHYVPVLSNLNSPLYVMVNCLKFSTGVNMTIWVGYDSIVTPKRAYVQQTGDSSSPSLLAEVATNYNGWRASVGQLFATWVYTMCDADLAASNFTVLSPPPQSSFSCKNIRSSVEKLATFGVYDMGPHSNWIINGTIPTRMAPTYRVFPHENQDPRYHSQNLLMHLPHIVCMTDNDAIFSSVPTSLLSPLDTVVTCGFQGNASQPVTIYVGYDSGTSLWREGYIMIPRFHQVMSTGNTQLPSLLSYEYMDNSGQDSLTNMEAQMLFWVELACRTPFSTIVYSNETINDTRVLQYQVTCPLGNQGISPITLHLIQGELLSTGSSSTGYWYNGIIMGMTAPAPSSFEGWRFYWQVPGQDSRTNQQAILQRVMLLQCGAVNGPILPIPATWYPVTLSPGSCGNTVGTACMESVNSAGVITSFGNVNVVNTFNTKSGAIVAAPTAGDISITESPTNTFTWDLVNAGTAGTYAYPISLTTDVKGRTTSVTASAQPVTSFTLSGGTTRTGAIIVAPTAGDISITESPTRTYTWDLVNTGPGISTVNYATITTDVKGRVSASSSGTTPVTSVSCTANQLVCSGTAPATFSLSSTLVFPGTVTATAGSVTTSAGGSSNRVLGTKLHENPSVMDYGAVGDCATDDSTAIQAGITALAASGGGHLYFPPACYAIATTITVTSSSITLYGDGSPDWISSSSVAGKTILKWTGGASVMLKVAPVAGAGNDPLQGVKIDRIGFLCQGVATYGVEIASSWMGWFNLYAEQCLTALVWTHVITPLAVNGGMQQNNLWIYGKQTTSGGNGIYADGNIAASPVATDTAFNFFHMVDIELGLGSNGIVLAFTDHNYFAMAAFPALGSSTGYAVWFKGGASLSEASHGNIIQFLSASIPYVYAEGTELGQAFASYGNIVYRYNIGATLPTIGTGASFQWGDDTGTCFGPNNLFTTTISDSVGLARAAALLINGQSLYIANAANNHITLSNNGATVNWGISAQTSTGNLRLVPGTGGVLVAVSSAATFAGTLQTLISGTSASNGIILGSLGDTTIYRNAIGTARIDGTFSATHYICNSGTPTGVLGTGAGTGAGTSPSFSITGTDAGFQLLVTTGTQVPAATATIITVTFATAYPNNADAVVYSPFGVNAATLSGASHPYVISQATTGFVFTGGSTPLAISTAYRWNFSIRAS